ncbi:MAG: alpha/beta fold hydrolase [Anaerolineae bacterium]|nr:alpha/beta fold hydrolase [Anaerolineae bacterium]
MQGFLAVFLITLGLGQLISTCQGWRAASLVGPRRLAGYGLSLLLLVAGALLLPNSWGGVGWALPAALLALLLLLLAGSYIDPPPHPDCLFEGDHPAHGSCRHVQIPDGDYLMPGYLLTPPDPLHLPPEGGVLVIHGAGDTKTSYKWRLVQALLAEGLTVLTIDLPGHGDYRQRPLAYPDCLSAIPAAVRFLRAQPGIERVGLVGISLGSVLAIASLVQTIEDPKGLKKPLGSGNGQIDALAALETPVALKYSRGLRYGEMWHAYRAPVLSLWREVSVRQLRQSWFTGGYVSRHKNTAEIIELLNPLENIAKLGQMPILLVHGGRDSIAPAAAGRTLQQAAPQATLMEVKGASHVTLTLMVEANRKVARWVTERLGDRG